MSERDFVREILSELSKRGKPFGDDEIIALAYQRGRESALAESAPAAGSELTGDWFLQHETSYTQKPGGRFEWKCSCGDSAEDFASWEECHKFTRQHWASKLNVATPAPKPALPDALGVREAMRTGNRAVYATALAAGSEHTENHYNCNACAALATPAPKPADLPPYTLPCTCDHHYELCYGDSSNWPKGCVNKGGYPKEVMK